MRRIGIVGAGPAGLAAAWAARARGLDVTLFDRGVAAASYGSGALDPGARTFSERAADFLREWGRYASAQPGRTALVATRSGVLREVAGASEWTLDLERLRGAKVGVLDFGYADFSGERLARAWSAEPHARARELRFEVLDGSKWLGFAVKESSPRARARHFEQGERARELVTRLDEEVARLGLGAVLTDSIGGADGPLPGSTATPIGEVLLSLDGPGDERHERNRSAFLARLGLVPIEERVVAWAERADRVLVETKHETREFDALVVAVGGLVSGGATLGSGGLTPTIRTDRAEAGTSGHFDPTRDEGRFLAARRSLPLRVEPSGRVAFAGEVVAPSTLGFVVDAGLEAVARLLTT